VSDEAIEDIIDRIIAFLSPKVEQGKQELPYAIRDDFLSPAEWFLASECVPGLVLRLGPKQRARGFPPGAGGPPRNLIRRQPMPRSACFTTQVKSTSPSFHYIQVSSDLSVAEVCKREIDPPREILAAKSKTDCLLLTTTTTGVAIGQNEAPGPLPKSLPPEFRIRREFL
jgi:hypothetical protein